MKSLNESLQREIRQLNERVKQSEQDRDVYIRMN
jgi:hypothetical protein